MERLALARGITLKKDNHYQALVGKDGGLWLVLPLALEWVLGQERPPQVPQEPRGGPLPQKRCPDSVCNLLRPWK